jgi:uncharacterized protein (TIGR03437 family)
MKRIILLAFLSSPVFAQPPGGAGGTSGDGIWVRNAAYGEAQTFDNCNGHQPQSGTYHHHINPICLRAQLNDNVTVVSTGRLGTKYAEKASGWTHSPILGWANDGYPVYGPYGYSDPTNANSAIKRIQSSFTLRSITTRTSLPSWILPYLPNDSQTLTSSQYGPAVSALYPLGRYVDDYDYVAGSGDLDQYNGRFTVTPDYPNGTYAYFVTLDSTGAPAFPYIINVQFYGTASGGSTKTVASDAVDYFNNGAVVGTGSTDPRLNSWLTKNSTKDAQAISGWNPAAGASTTWPTGAPSGAAYSGGVSTPTLADTQRVRYDANYVYVNANDLPSYTFGPWFEASMTGGVFINWPSSQAGITEFPRSPSAATTKAASGMGPVGSWVNGVSIFNVLDGGSYSNSAGADEGGGGVMAEAIQVSSASNERGPMAAGSLVSAYSEFAATLATSTATASSANWPLTLGGATVTVTDSTNASLSAQIYYASPSQVNYRMPPGAASGTGKVTITAGGTSVSGTVNIVATYPGIFTQTADGLAAAQVLIGGNYQSVSTTPISIAGGSAYLILYATGIGSATTTATINGVNATVQYSGAEGVYPGLDQVNILIPSSLAGAGKVSVVVTSAGVVSNPVYLYIQ